MAIFTVHSRSEGPDATDDARFLGEEFSWPAFFLGPFWILRHGLWLPLTLWIAAFLLLILATLLAVPAGGGLAVALLLQILLGLEAHHLVEIKLARRGYRLLEVVAAPTADEAEIAFHRQWAHPSEDRPAPADAKVSGRASPTHGDVLGSFPRSGARQ